MNLNISTQFINNFQGNNTIKDTACNKTEFKGVFEILGNIDEEINLDTNEENLEAIIYDLLKNILNNKIIDFRELSDFKENTFSTSEQVDGNFKNQLDLLKQIGSLLKSNGLDEGSINNEIKLDNNEFYELIKQNIENGNFDNEELVQLKKILDKGLTPSIKNLKTETTDIENKLKQEVNNLEAYKKLEVSSLSNKNNILENNLQKLDIKDKDLSTLESILDIKDGNDFMFQNNNLNSLSTKASGNNGLKEVPINNIRQEFIGEDIVKTVKYLNSNGIEEIKIKISPRELGDMTIKLIKNAEETKVSIIVSKEDVFDMVNKNIGDITKHLSDLNIKIKEIAVDIKNDNQKFFSENLNQEFNKKEQEFNKRNQENKKKRNKYQQVGIENIEDINQKESLEENINILI
ncbi:flagellar hook-length control protein FliK [Romboutsia sp.]|uniref:flagellar hook-length control protein FliK n=1 Tax=Romboutsia sp. TaxID=1965302 RepID=UPI002C3120E9|nr:flagellar hook-length control protein FliK [Romboutsia sp.]HSQ87850.1 flagellar hook-length control protein FliK [Romboutsia sp.]